MLNCKFLYQRFGLFVFSFFVSVPLFSSTLHKDVIPASRSLEHIMPGDYQLGELQVDFRKMDEDLSVNTWKIYAGVQAIKKYFLQHPEEFEKLKKLYSYFSSDWTHRNDAGDWGFTRQAVRDTLEGLSLLFTFYVYSYFVICTNFEDAAPLIFCSIYTTNLCRDTLKDLNGSYRREQFVSVAGLNPLAMILFQQLECNYFDLVARAQEFVEKIETDSHFKNQMPLCCSNFINDIVRINKQSSREDLDNLLVVFTYNFKTLIDRLKLVLDVERALIAQESSLAIQLTDEEKKRLLYKGIDA